MNAQRWESEQGAIFVFVALAILVLVAFLVFVIDHGILTVARGQAQNAADAGALAGAVGRAFDDLATPPADDGIVATAAINAAQANTIWDGPGVAQVSWDCPPGVAGRCVRVDVYRNGQFGSLTLPTVFGPVLSISSQRVRATATAVVASGNATNCLRPFAVPDGWIDANGNEIYDAGEVYRPPSGADGTPTGFSLETHYGVRVLLHGDSHYPPRIAPGWFQLLRLGAPGGNQVRNSIRGCVGEGYQASLGDELDPEMGGTVGPVNQGINDLIDLDPDAYWDGDSIENSCVTSGTCYRYDSDGNRVPDPTAAFSPRIVPVPVFDPVEQFTTGRLVMVNMLGLFIEEMPNHKDVWGVYVRVPDLYVTGAGSITPGSTFITNIRLVR